MRQKSFWQTFDWGLLLIALILTGIGVAMIYSATKDAGDLADLWQRQAIYAGVGVVMMFIISAIDYGILESLQWPLLIATIGVLIFTLLFGSSEIGDVRRFIYIGGTSIQPAFPALILLIISQAGLLARKSPDNPGFLEFALSTGIAAITAFLVFRQPNLSTATLYVATWAIMVFASGLNLAFLGGSGLVGAMMLPVIWANLSDYMRDRIYTFLDPTNDPGAYYNIRQALIGIGSGGLLGKGFATGTQSQLHFLRVRHTDFIFSVICEELGFVGAVGILLIFGLLLWRLLRIAANADDLSGKLMVTGVIGYIYYQLLINLAMNLNIIPVAGLPMPFISSGGSALVVAYMGLGLAQSVSTSKSRIRRAL